MTETLTTDAEVRQVWASDRRKAALAARLLACCLGIQARPGFDLTGEQRGGPQRSKAYAMGECVFKDAWDVSPEEECGRLELLLVDEEGSAPRGAKSPRRVRDPTRSRRSGSVELRAGEASAWTPNRQAALTM